MSQTSKPVILAIDQGTTATTVVAMDRLGRTLSKATREFKQYFPKPGWVEHDPDEIWASVLDALAQALRELPQPVEDIAALGLTNQRETIVVWDRASGRPVHRALVWQDRRTTERCHQLKHHADEVREVTGLVVDPYFSATKVAWLLDQDVGLRAAAEHGRLSFGTIDSFLVDRLAQRSARSAGPALIEVTNASRTLLMDLRSRQFSRRMCDLFGVPSQILPRIVPSSGTVAHTHAVPGLPNGIPISGIAGDQHAALLGQGCIQPGDAKCTYGTGAFVLVNTGGKPLTSESGLLTTLAWQIGDEVTYALEGSSFIAGAAVQWLRDGLGLIEHAAEIETLALSVESSEGVTFVPALAGLGAPHWDAEARGLVCGLTRGTTRGHLARATLDAIAFQVDDLLSSMDRDLKQATGAQLQRLRVDGGAARNDLLLQIQADISGISVDRPREVDATARGAGLLAALGVGALSSLEEAHEGIQWDRCFDTSRSSAFRQKERARWEQSVARASSSL